MVSVNENMNEEDSSSNMTSKSSSTVTSAGPIGKKDTNLVINDEEAELYDRQIRLWGLDAQNRLKNSSVLVVGLTGLGAEVTKNLMLVGVKSLTLLDNNLVTDDDLKSQFLVSIDSVGQNRAEASKLRTEELNPMVAVIVDTDQLVNKSDDYFKQFNLICLINQTYDNVERINMIARANQIKFVIDYYNSNVFCSAGVYGWFGYAFFDFLNHEFFDHVKKPQFATLDNDDNEVIDGENNEDGPSKSKKAKLYANDDDDTVMVKSTIYYNTWIDALNVNWSLKSTARKSKRLLPQSYFVIAAILKAYKQEESFDFKSAVGQTWIDEVKRCNLDPEMQTCKPEHFDKFIDGQLSPVCAIVGGILGQEIIKALSQKGRPLQNMFLYSAIDTTGIVCCLPPSTTPDGR